MCIVDGRWAKQLQASVDRDLRDGVGDGPIKSVDIDFNVLGLDGQDVFIHPNQGGRAHVGLGRDKFRDVGFQARDHVERGRLHDSQAKVHLVHDQAHRTVIDVVGQAVGDGGPGVIVDAAYEVRAIAVRPTHAGKAGQVGAAQGQRLHAQGHGVQAGVQHLAELVGNGCQAAQVDRDVELLALAEGQGATQVQEIGHGDFGQAHVQAQEFGATQAQVDRCTAGGDFQSVGGARILDAGVDRHGTHDPTQSLAAGVDINGDVLTQYLEHVTHAVDAHFIGVRTEREHALRIHELRQHGLEVGDRHTQVLQSKADQAPLL